MESDVIVEGIWLAETAHGHRYMRFIGHGDSSVHCDIRTKVPRWGRMVQKIECANHSVKCYRARLEKIIQDHKNFKRVLTPSIIKRLTVGARCAIKMHATTGNVQQLRHDLRYGPNHVFNDHQHCNPVFCQVKAERLRLHTFCSTICTPTMCVCSLCITTATYTYIIYIYIHYIHIHAYIYT